MCSVKHKTTLSRMKQTDSTQDNSTGRKRSRMLQLLTQCVKRLAWLGVWMLFTLPLHAQSRDADIKQAQAYQREAEYYTRRALNYEREADYYNRQAQNHLREAAYYTKKNKINQAKYEQQKAKRATERSEYYDRKARTARNQAQSLLKKAERALRKR